MDGATGVLRPCLDCGVPVEPNDRRRGARCIPCRDADLRMRSKHRVHKPKPPGHTTASGYDGRWRRLSERARRLHPMCMDCGTSADLTTDHLRWPARSLLDVEVVCRRCNSRRGPLRSHGVPVRSRGGNPVGGTREPKGGSPTIGYTSERKRQH